MEHNWIFVEDEREEIKNAFYADKINEDERDLMDQSNNSRSILIRKSNQNDRRMQNTAIANMNSSIDYESKDLSIKKITFEKVEPLREFPSDQQEGVAYYK
jgi:hypothetical protein